MKQFAIGLMMVCLGGAGTAQAQTQAQTQTQAQAQAPAHRIFAEVDGGATFGGQSSWMVQAQAGYRFWPDVDLFVEVGRMQNVSSNSLAVRAGVVTSYLTALGKGTATAKTKVPTTFGAIGARYYLPTYIGRMHPYALGALGIASANQNVRFSLAGSDITGSIGNYGVALGSDLSGTQTRALFSFGGGVTMAWDPIYVDAALRYYRLFTKPTGTNIGSFYVGVGYKF